MCVCVCVCQKLQVGAKFAPTNQPETLGSIGLWHHRLLDVQGVPWTHGFSQTPSIFLDVHPCLRDLCYWQGGFKYFCIFTPNLGVSWSNLITLQGTNISPKNGILKMIFLLPRWDMLIPWRVIFFRWVGSTTTWAFPCPRVGSMVGFFSASASSGHGIGSYFHGRPEILPYVRNSEWRLHGVW